MGFIAENNDNKYLEITIPQCFYETDKMKKKVLSSCILKHFRNASTSSKISKTDICKLLPQT